MQINSEPMDTSKQFCPNETRCARGKMGAGNITIHDRKRRRYRCKVCKQTFSERRGTMFEGLRKPRCHPDYCVAMSTSLGCSQKLAGFLSCSEQDGSLSGNKGCGRRQMYLLH